MMAGSGGSSPLCEQLGKLDLGHDIIAVVLMVPLRKPEVLEGLPLPVVMLINGLNAAQITVDVTGDVPLAITMKAINAESAQAVEGMAKGLLAKGKKQVVALAEDPFIGPMLLMFDAEIKGALDNIVIAKTGTDVTVDFKIAKYLKAAIAKQAAKAAEGAKQP
jgi:hypothetical protein